MSTLLKIYESENLLKWRQLIQNVSLIARSNSCFMIELSGAHEADVLDLVNYFSIWLRFIIN